MPARRTISFGNLLSSFRSSRRAGDHGDEDDREPYSRMRHAVADFTEAEDDEDDEEEEQPDDEEDEDEDDDQENTGTGTGTVLPLFSESHLDALPVYSITHAIRVIVQSRTETTLTWDQLRSPQVSQFLVKPMQVQIRQSHFSRATIYALMANSLQFAKEGQLNPGNAGSSSTRAKVCELLAIKLLKEYSTRELIDALSYDFYPLQGIPGVQTPTMARDTKAKPAAARTSTLEVAIRASAKHFLAHPLVVQQLEAIWNGAISFYSSADNLHRQSIKGTPQSPSARSPAGQNGNERTPLLQFQKGFEIPRQQPVPVARRTVNLYDPRNASLFKLSRLRVPRYRQFFSTCSLAILIGLFLAVLIQRSNPITSLELVFWFWSAGFMLDELVGFTEQGFSLYIMSFWNIFDLGILLLLIIYYCMRIYTVFLVGSHQGVDAYDILAANAVLLLPRIFSVLDHYPYFSQIILAIKIMSVDLAAVFVLISVSCSGFFVFFLANTKADAGEVAYKIFQILMGFTPAAWDVWPSYNWLDRTLMGLFLIICHFVVVTVLITVLTNSFMSIASNAKEEHQFLFAINTIAMVKDQSLFSYMAPGNIFAWVLMPLRYFMPLRLFVWLNRMIIKITHFPLLWLIFLYEKYVLAPSMYEPTDFVDNPGMGTGRARALSMNPAGRPSLFSPNIRIRDESVAGFQQDRALAEVFRRTPDFATLREHRMNERKRTQNNVRNWMDRNDNIPESPNAPRAGSGTPKDWCRKLSLAREGPPRRRHISEVRSVASDPAELEPNVGFPVGGDGYFDGVERRDYAERRILKDQDADDELLTNDEDDDEATAPSRHSNAKSNSEGGHDDYFKTLARHFNDNFVPTSLDTSRPPMHQQVSRQGKRTGLHGRTLSSNTILFNPTQQSALYIPDAELEMSPGAAGKNRSRVVNSHQTPVGSPTVKSPRRNIPAFAGVSRPRPVMPNRDVVHTTGNGHRNGLTIDVARPRRGKAARRMSSSDLLDIQSNLAGVANDDAFGGVPSSFVTQMAMATGMITPGNRAKDKAQRDRDNDDRDRMSRLVLARMKTLEEGFSEVIRGMRDMQRTSTLTSTAHTSASEGTGSVSWTGEHMDMRPFTALHTGVRAGGSRAKAGPSMPVSRPGSSRRSGDKSSNRNSVILRSPIGSHGGAKLKGKGKEFEMSKQQQQQRQQQSDSDSDIGTFGGEERRPLRRRGSSV